jgi:hypothetical protein
MSEIIDGEAKRVEPLEFYVFSDGMGINEIRFTPDPQFVMSTFLGVALFIAGNLECNDGQLKTSKMLRDMAEIAEKMEAVESEGGEV